MTHEEENLSQTTITTSAELVLLGHISNNISLLEQYNYSLHADDFHDDGGRISYSFLQDYYKTYSADLTPEKMALLHIKWIANNEVYRKLFKKPERINEMTQEQFEKILLCTIVNMPQLCALHGQTLHMTQSDITQPQFRTTDGQPIEKQLHETTEDYMKRLEAESSTFKAYLNILDWLQTNYRNMFHFKNISDDYSIERIRMEIRTAKKKGCRVVAYDTLKSCGSAEWGELQQTATELSEVIKSDPDSITGLATFQLTDDTVYKNPEDLNSNNIANAKHIMHVTDNMLMFKMINPQEFCVKIQEPSGAEKRISIPKDTNVAAFKIVKNRNGAGKDVLFGVQTNLDYNVWHPLGTLCRIYTR
ncbi:MAG: hypothetical protein E7631_02650 [Ruminococcaceae bacterium]|nr:hypothetical protein [Oscillospiraceae bacterium]